MRPRLSGTYCVLAMRFLPYFASPLRLLVRLRNASLPPNASASALSACMFAMRFRNACRLLMRLRLPMLFCGNASSQCVFVWGLIPPRSGRHDAFFGNFF